MLRKYVVITYKSQHIRLRPRFDVAGYYVYTIITAGISFQFLLLPYQAEMPLLLLFVIILIPNLVNGVLC